MTNVLRRIVAALPTGGALPDEVWEKRHRAILLLLWAHVPGLVLFAVLRGYGLSHGLLEAAPAAMLAVAAGPRQFRRSVRSALAALGLVICSGVVVHLSGGTIEAHFHFFVMVGVMSMYQDWTPFLVVIGYTVLHHGTMGVLDPRSVYNFPAAWNDPWTWAGIHGGFVLAASAAHIAAWKLNEVSDAKAKKAEAEVAFLAYHDKLTRLANRAMFEELLGMSLARAERHDLAVAVLFLDLDDFKLVNDTLGHAAGDDLLVQVADRLRSITRQTDLVARQGGDEFLLLLSDLEGSKHFVPGDEGSAYVAAETAAQRIQEALKAPFEVAGQELYASASIGLSVYPTDAADGVALLKNADTAMYWSKRSGPAGYRVFSAAEVGVPTHLSLGTRLRRAVEEQQWVLHYQPLVELASGRMTGVEALLRWPDPAGGLIPPGEFIPLAEEMGLIEAIGVWVIEELCRQDAAWRAEGVELGLSFNLSARQLRQRKLAESIVEPFEAHHVDPGRVVIEITESAAMADPERTQRILHDLRERGFRVAIDDFGTGYSSLSRLRHLPLDILKIDRSFILDVPADEHARSMVAGIIRLADGVGMTPFAEGVETELQRAFLVASGCELGQGYLFARPMPPDQIAASVDRAGHVRTLTRP